MYRSIAYVKHLITATNQHGVHSPFVYKFVTQCLYTKVKFKGLKVENVLVKSIRHFSFEKIKIDSNDACIEQRIQNELRLKVSYESPYDLIYFDDPPEKLLLMYTNKIHNDSMIILGNIHKNKSATFIWDHLRNNEMVTVSIDLFYCGVLFFRKEQAKEHFKIRI